MQARTPVDTGNLKSSESVDVAGLRFEAGPTADYGEYVELGTSRMAAEPYAGPAFDQELGGIVDALGDAGEPDPVTQVQLPVIRRQVLGDLLRSTSRRCLGSRSSRCSAARPAIRR
jgi:hypothetical protein